MFRAQKLDLSPFQHSMLRDKRSEMFIMLRASNELESCSRRLPFTLQMLATLQTLLCDPVALNHRGVVIAVMMGLVFLLRASEVLYTAADHFIRTNDVQFEFTDPLSKVVNMFSAFEANSMSSSSLTGVIVHIRSAKNDQKGSGNQKRSKRIKGTSH